MQLGLNSTEVEVEEFSLITIIQGKSRYESITSVTLDSIRYFYVTELEGFRILATQARQLIGLAGHTGEIKVVRIVILWKYGVTRNCF